MNDTLQKQLEAAQLINDLLQSSLEDSQRKVVSLEASQASLSREGRGKDARIATLTLQMRDMIRKFEVCCCQ